MHKDTPFGVVYGAISDATPWYILFEESVGCIGGAFMVPLDHFNIFKLIFLGRGPITKDSAVSYMIDN